MAITIRRGTYADFVPSKLQPGEFADVTEGDPNTASGRALYVCLASGNVVRVPNQEDLDAVAADAAAEASVYADSAKRSADKAEALAQPDLTIDDVISKIIDKDTADSAFGKYVIEQYTGTTLNGSAQSVKSFVDGFVGKNIASNTDLNDLTAPGFYYCSSAATAQSLENCPITANFSMIVMRKSGSLQSQLIISGAPLNPRIYTRTRTSSGWGAWKSLAIMENDVTPLQERIGRLGYKHFYINPNSSATFSVDNATHAKMIITSTAVACMAEILLVTTTAGAFRTVEIHKGSAITITTNTGKITVANGSTQVGIHVKFLILNDDSSDRQITLDGDTSTASTLSTTSTEGGE